MDRRCRVALVVDGIVDDQCGGHLRPLTVHVYDGAVPPFGCGPQDVVEGPVLHDEDLAQVSRESAGVLFGTVGSDALHELLQQADLVASVVVETGFHERGVERCAVHGALHVLRAVDVEARDHVHIQSLEHPAGVGVVRVHPHPVEDVLARLQPDPLQVLGIRLGREEEEEVQIGVRQVCVLGIRACESGLGIDAVARHVGFDHLLETVRSILYGGDDLRRRNDPLQDLLFHGVHGTPMSAPV